LNMDQGNVHGRPPEQRFRLYYILSGKVSNFAKGLSVRFGFRQIGVRSGSHAHDIAASNFFLCGSNNTPVRFEQPGRCRILNGSRWLALL